MIKIPRDAIELKSLELVWIERLRQKEVEGYTPAHDDDDEHDQGQLAILASYYALSSAYPDGPAVGPLPAWYSSSLNYLRGIVESFGAGWKVNPKSPIRDLVRAGALILAELERRLRADEGVKLPMWQSHKIVAADKIVAAVDESPSMHGHWELLCGASVPVNLQLAHRVPEGINPIGGYYVRYKDGFESWSPAEAFEQGYRRLP